MNRIGSYSIPEQIEQYQEFEADKLPTDFDANKADGFDRVEYLYNLIRTFEKQTYVDIALAPNPEEKQKLVDRMNRIYRAIDCIRPVQADCMDADRQRNKEAKARKEAAK